MASTRTQIYLTVDQRRALDEIARREGKAMAEVVRDAVDAYLSGTPLAAGQALDATFAAIPDLQVPPRDGWERGD